MAKKKDVRDRLGTGEIRPVTWKARLVLAGETLAYGCQLRLFGVPARDLGAVIRREFEAGIEPMYHWCGKPWPK